MSKCLPIVVVTPVKNEEWILERYLSVTSIFADVIIVADQGSTDSSRSICRKYDKVVLIKNPKKEYDEASRQLLLLEKAREIVEGEKIILALDADEILAANAMQTSGWNAMMNCSPGTVLHFEKPDLYLSPETCVRWRNNPHPLGFVDDGSQHIPKAVHSIRIPQPENSLRIAINDVKFLHYGMANPSLQLAKMRYYSVVENILKIKTAYKRRHAYKRTWLDRFKARVEPSDPNWFLGWESGGIDMFSIVNKEYSWHDFAILRFFKENGVKRFYSDDIWYIDWEKRRLYGQRNGKEGMPEDPICTPGVGRQILYDVICRTYGSISHMKNYFF